MTARTAHRTPAGPSRAGFTLLEMLAVILIIAILIAVAFPAYNAVMQNARIATARTDIASIDNAIATFKSEFNTEPPSYIDFRAASPAALPPSTKAMLRQMFGQIDLSATSPIEASLTTAGLWDQQLSGSECLVFFLGGVRKHDGTVLTTEHVGFSKNPANPFAQPAAGQANRLGPFLEFDSSRLVDTETPTPDGLLEYVDALPGQSTPLLYVSTARTGSYVKDDLLTQEGISATWSPYQKTAGASPTYWNPKSYQIISPGFDKQYGNGGLYNPTSTSQLDQLDTDNLTNFADGRLGG